MSDENPYSRTYFGDRPVEVLRDDSGQTVAEIVQNENEFQVWRKEPAAFPPRRRHTLLATFPTLREALARAPALIEITETPD